jgi:hypothetical protein
MPLKSCGSYLYHRTGEKIFLKIDTQGFEKNVLEGANSSLEHITSIQ